MGPVKRTLAMAASALLGALAGVANVGIPNTAVAGTSGCTRLAGTVQGGGICHFWTSNSAYYIELKFSTDYPDDQPVADYIAQQRDEVIHAAEAPGATGLPYGLELNFDLYRSGQPTRTTPDYGKPWHGTASEVINSYKYMDAPPRMIYKSFTFDYDQNRPVTFDNMFAPGSNPVDSIYPAVKAELERQFKYRGFTLGPNVGRNPAIYQNFAITDDTVIFFFDTAELMVEEAGYFYAPIPRSKLPPLQI